MKGFYVIALVVVILLVLTPYAFLDEEAPRRFEGQTVAYDIYPTEINSVDPATCGDVASGAIQGNFYESLYDYHYLKRPLEVVPQLASALPEVSQDGLTYTIPLRRDVKYSPNACFGLDDEGNPQTRTIRAEDFVLSFKRIADFHITTRLSLSFIEDKIAGLREYRMATRRYRKGDLSRYDKEKLVGVTALDAHTVQIRLTKKFPQLLYVLAMHVYAPVPRELVDYHLVHDPTQGGQPRAISECDPEIRQCEAVVGTGAYVLSEWIRAGKIILERNPAYASREECYPTEGAPGDAEAGLLDDAGKKPVPFVDVWYLTFVKETNPQWMLFMECQRDVGGIPPDVYNDVIDPNRDLTEKMGEKGIRLLKSSYPAVYWIAFNTRDPVLGASKSLRQAIAMCYDAETHIDVLFNGRGKRAMTMLPSTFKGYVQAIGPDNGPYFWRDLERYRIALEKARESKDAKAVEAALEAMDEAQKSQQARAVEVAKAKIDDARKELQAAGVIKPGEPIPALTLDLGDTSEQSRRMGEFARGQFKQIGLELNIELNEWSALQQKVNNKQVQMYFMGWHADYPDAENFLQLFYSPNIRRGTNDTNFENTRFDELYAKASVLMNEADRVPLYVEMLKIINEECPCLPISEPLTFILVHPWVHNVKPHPIGYGFRKYRRLDTEMRQKMGGR